MTSISYNFQYSYIIHIIQSQHFKNVQHSIIFPTSKTIINFQTIKIQYLYMFTQHKIKQFYQLTIPATEIEYWDNVPSTYRSFSLGCY